MNNRKDKPIRSKSGNWRDDMKISETRHRVAKNYGVTKGEFHALLRKASQPIKSEAESDSEKSGT